VYTACGDSIARAFDAKSGALKRTFKGHTGAVNCLKVNFNVKFNLLKNKFVKEFFNSYVSFRL
jgi:hypothetical protein